MNYPKWQSKESILEQVRSESRQSKEMVNQFRSDYARHIEDFHKRWDDVKIYDRSIKTLVGIVQAIHAKSEVEVDFCLIWEQPSNSRINALKALAERDFKKGKRSLKNKQKIEDAWVAGAAVELQVWNGMTKCNDSLLMNPADWIFSSYNINYGFSYHGFEMSMGKYELMASWFLNTDNIKTKKREKIEKEMERLRKEWYKGGNLYNSKEIQAIVNRSSRDDDLYSILLWITRLDGVPYMIYCDASMSEILKIEEVKAVTKEQEEMPRTIPFPVTVSRWFFNPARPTGDSVFDLVGDKQYHREEIMNLNLHKVREIAMWGDFLVDADVIDLTDLQRPSRTGKRLIPYDSSKWGDPFRQVPRDNVSQEAFMMPETLQGELFYNSGYDRAAAWITGEAGLTATENVRAQKNANLLTLSKEDYFAVYDEDYYYTWLCQYARSWETEFKVPTSIGDVYMEVKITASEIKQMLPSIVIEPISKKKREQEKKQQVAQMFYWQWKQAAKTEYTSYLVDKWAMEAQWLNEYDIEDLLDEPLELIQGKLDVALINNNEEVKREIDVMNEDHQAYLNIYRTAKDNKRKRSAITKRLMAQVEKKKAMWVQQQQQEQQQWNNAMQNVAMAQSMQQQTQESKAPSALDVTM